MDELGRGRGENGELGESSDVALSGLDTLPQNPRPPLMRVGVTRCREEVPLVRPVSGP